MDDKKIARINELYHKSKTTGLTEAEKEEQKALRQEYVWAIKNDLRNTLNNDLQSNGRLRKVQKKEKPGLSNSTVRGIHMMLHNALDRAVKSPPKIIGYL